MCLVKITESRFKFTESESGSNWLNPFGIYGRFYDVFQVSCNNRSCLNLVLDLLDMLLHTEKEYVETCVDRIRHDVFLISLRSVKISDQVHDVFGGLIHVEDRRYGVQTDSVQLVRFSHGHLAESVEIALLHGLFQLSDVLGW